MLSSNALRPRHLFTQTHTDTVENRCAQSVRCRSFDSCRRSRRLLVKLPHEVARRYFVASAAAAQYVRHRRLWWQPGLWTSHTLPLQATIRDPVVRLTPDFFELEVIIKWIALSQRTDSFISPSHSYNTSKLKPSKRGRQDSVRTPSGLSQDLSLIHI